MCFFCNIFEEFISDKKLMEKRSNKKAKTSLEKFVTNKNGSLNLDQQTDLHLENKLNLLEDFIENLKHKFIFKKITDVSMNIRLMISEYIFKISKYNFSEFFDDDSIKFYPFFLIDPSHKIKLKYLQIIYDKLEDMDEKDFECIIKVLKESRDLILNICIKEEKTIAKRGIKIIELISKHNILDLKTVNLLLPHLFNPDPNIRNLISNVVLNYILNFESRNIINEAKEEEEENEIEIEDDKLNYNNKSKVKKEELMDVCDEEENEKDKTSIHNKSQFKYSIENLIEIFEFFAKLTEKDEKMIKVLVDNFYPKMNVFKNFTLFFDLIDTLLNKTNVEPYKLNSQSGDSNKHNSNSDYIKLLKICLIVLKYSIEKLQDEIDSANTSNDINNIMKEQIPLNEEFLNNLVSRTPAFIKKILISDEMFYETFVVITNLFENLKIYNYNLIKFDVDIVYSILEELQKVFFHNFIMKNENGLYSTYNNFITLAIENIGKIIIKLLNFLSINKMNEEIAKTNEKNIIKDLCSKLYDKINSKILNNKFFITEEIKEQINNEQAEELIYLIVRMDCVLNYFGSYNDNFLSQLNFVKFQTLIFNLISYFKFKIQSNISRKLILLDKLKTIEIESKSSNYSKESNPLEENMKELDSEINHNEFFLQNFTNYGLKIIKSLNLVLLTKIIYNLDTISNENNITISESISNPSQSNNINNTLMQKKSETAHYYETYLKYVSNLFKNFENSLNYEFNYHHEDMQTNLNNFKKNEEINKFVQEKNYINLEIKSNLLCLILDIIIYISSEKLDIYSFNSDLKIKFQLNDSILVLIEKFIKKEYVFFFFAGSKKLKELNDEIRTLEIQQENEDLEEKELDKLNLMNDFKRNIESIISIKTIFFKNICESFSKLLVQNLAMFKNRNLVTLFFETFYLIKYPVIIESINNIVFENLLEKEILYYLKDEENNKINWMIFYFTKISVKLFGKNSTLFNFEEYLQNRIVNKNNQMDLTDDIKSSNEENVNEKIFNFYEFFFMNNFSEIENYDLRTKKNDSLSLILINDDEKINMLKRYFEIYLKSLRKIKNSFSKEISQSIENKDKKFLEEFICKSLNYALQSRIIREVEVENITRIKDELKLDDEFQENTTEKNSENKNEKKFEKRIYIENIRFLELIKHILKNSSFISENEYKTFLMLFVKLVKDIEATDNVNRADIKIIENVKSFLLNKAKLYANHQEDKAKENSDDDRDVENQNKNFKKKKGTLKNGKNHNIDILKDGESESEDESDLDNDLSKKNIKNKKVLELKNQDYSEEEIHNPNLNKKVKKENDKIKKLTLKKENKNNTIINSTYDINHKIGKKRIHEDVKILFYRFLTI